MKSSRSRDTAKRFDQLGEEMGDAGAKPRREESVRMCMGSGSKRLRAQTHCMNDTFHADPAEPLGPHLAGKRPQGQRPLLGAFLQTIEYSQYHKTVAEGDVPNEVRTRITKNRSVYTSDSNKKVRPKSTSRRSAHHQLHRSRKATTGKDASHQKLDRSCNSLCKQLPQYSLQTTCTRTDHRGVLATSCSAVRRCVESCKRATRSCANYFRDAKPLFPAMNAAQSYRITTLNSQTLR